MDPLAAWKELLDALTEMDWERVLESAENLELLPNVVFRENVSGDDFGMSCRGFGGCRFEVIS